MAVSVEIPWHRIADFQPRPVLFSGDQEGSLGGPSLPVPRLGDRFAVDVVTATLRNDAASRNLLAALFRGTTMDVRMAFRLPNHSGNRHNGVVVDGADQAGSVLAVRGVPPGGAFGLLDPISIVHNGVHHVHLVMANGLADGAGKAMLPIWPMLRFLTVDGERVAYDDPMIEGKLVGFDAKGMGFERNRTRSVSFSIVERK